MRFPGVSEPSNTDYERFLGPARNTSFNKQRYFNGGFYWDYSGGISTDLLVHQTDAIHMITGRHYCDSVVCNGGVHHWTQDDREVPDTVTAAYEYDDHFHLSYTAAFSTSHYSYGEQLCGSEGTMEIMGMRYLNVYPKRPAGSRRRSPRGRKCTLMRARISTKPTQPTITSRTLLTRLHTVKNSTAPWSWVTKLPSPATWPRWRCVKKRRFFGTSVRGLTTSASRQSRPLYRGPLFHW